MELFGLEIGTNVKNVREQNQKNVKNVENYDETFTACDSKTR